MTDTPKTPPQTTPPEKPHIVAARTLAADLASPKPAAQVLYDQAALLDALFAQLLHESIGTRHTLSGKPYRYVNGENIHMALRAQKQCRQTLDAAALRAPAAKKGERTESP